jgi:aspartate-semialdehyde dehydrogenase
VLVAGADMGWTPIIAPSPPATGATKYARQYDMRKKKAAVIGATGVAGQQFLVALSHHPWFEVTALAASERSAGKTYGDAITDASGAVRWYCQEPLDPVFARLPVEDASRLDAAGVDVVFTAVESDAARVLEPLYAKTTPVVSTASAFRYETDVPIFIPGVNLDHHRLIAVQKKNRGWGGFVTPVPNCTTTGLAMTLAPLQRAFGVQHVVMTSLQGCSGAGRSPGVVALDIIDNVVPYIPKEEEKVEIETRKILGTLAGEAIEPAAFRVSATCTRVPVLEAHTEAVYVSLGASATVDAVKAALREHGQEFLALGLPSSPAALIDVSEDPFRPQPRLDRDREDGMLTAVGRVRLDPVLPNGVKYVLVSHNTKMGAAKGAVLVAEYLVHAGHV